MSESSGTPKLGYCTVCLDLLWADLGAIPMYRTARVRSAPGARDTSEEMTEVRSVSHAVEAYERGNLINVQSRLLRMRADVLGPEEPRCVDHYRIVQSPGIARGPRTFR